MWIHKLVLLLAVGGVLSERRRYDGYKLLKVTPENEHQMKTLTEMENQDMFETFKEAGVGREGYILVPPFYTDPVAAKLRNDDVQVEVQADDIQILLDEENARLDARYENDPYNMDLDDFNRIEAIYAQYDQWVANCPAALNCEIINIGRTHEGVSMIVFKVGKKGATNKAIWLESVLHSREWIAAATELKMINHLVTRYSSDPEVTRMVDKYDWYFLPVGNPDGYIHSHLSDRFWRKNRRDPFPGAWCKGTDLNRNFEAYFGREGASPNICAQTYPGPGPNSEPETQNIIRFAARLKQQQEVIAWMCVHAMGRMWMFPYGHTYGHQGQICVRTDDHAKLMRVTNKAVDAVEATNGEYGRWKKGTICEVIYPATGDEISYAYDILKVKYPFALELRGANFVVDKSEIPLSFNEVWNGVVAMLTEIQSIEGN